MPPDYLSAMQDPSVFNIMIFIIKFYSMMIVFMILNVLFMVSFVWSLLIICRIIGLPWIDGTTKGFVNRT